MNTGSKSKVVQIKSIHFFIDESGTPEFYGRRGKLLVGKEGYMRLLLIGVISILNRKYVRKKIISFKNELLNDPDLADIYSLHQIGWYLHAKADHSKVREKFFNFLTGIKFKGYFIIGRKKLKIFHERHHKSEKEFYFDLVQNLLKDRFTDFENYNIFLSRRSGNSKESFTEAINNSIKRYNRKTKKENIAPKYNCSILASKETPELSIVDYMLWALQRYILQKDDRFFKLLIDKYTFIYDLYDQKKSKGSKYYNFKNPFDLAKANIFE